MKSTWTLKEKSTGELKVTIDGDQWKEAQEKAFKKLAAKTKIKGFRDGQAPEAMLRKAVSQQEIMYNAIDACANDALVFGVEEQKLNLVAQPTLDFDGISNEEVTLKFNCTVSPEVKLGDYKGIEYDETKVKVSSAEVKEELEKIQNKYTDLVLKEEGAVEKGNTAVIDFEGFKDGVAFDGGKAENYALEIGSNSFIPGFENQIIGMETNQEKDLEVTFPEEYQEKSLAGQPVTFKVKVNEIKTKVVPAMDEELVKELKLEGVETVKDLEKKIKADLKTKKENEADEKLNNDLLTKVVDAAEVEIPDVMVEEETNTMLEDFKNRLQQQGIAYDMYLQIVNQDEKSIREQMSKDAYNKVKVRLVLSAIAEKEKLEVEDSELEKEYQTIAEQYNMPIEEVKKYLTANTIKYDVRLRKALDFIKANAKKKEKDA